VKKPRLDSKVLRNFKSTIPVKLHFFSGDGREGVEYLCHACFNEIGIIHVQICFVCGVPVDILYGFPQDGFIWGCVGKYSL
jgi:hypothetical protein